MGSCDKSLHEAQQYSEPPRFETVNSAASKLKSVHRGSAASSIAGRTRSAAMATKEGLAVSFLGNFGLARVPQ